MRGIHAYTHVILNLFQDLISERPYVPSHPNTGGNGSSVRHSLFAFTLAEVLITLGIIGVVAAMTIPSLLNRANDLELKVAFKKQYSIISQVVAQAAINDGTFDSRFSNNDTFMALFKPYFKTIKSCANGDSSCWTGNNAKKEDYFLNNVSVSNGYGWWYVNRPVLVLSDGAFIQFAYLDSSCKGTDTGIIAPYAGTICGAIFLDVNGVKSPNTWGRDIFYIEVQKDKIFPLGPSSCSNFGCDKNSISWAAGLTCAEYVLGNRDY